MFQVCVALYSDYPSQGSHCHFLVSTFKISLAEQGSSPSLVPAKSYCNRHCTRAAGVYGTAAGGDDNDSNNGTAAKGAKSVVRKMLSATTKASGGGDA